MKVSLNGCAAISAMVTRLKAICISILVVDEPEQPAILMMSKP